MNQNYISRTAVLAAAAWAIAAILISGAWTMVFLHWGRLPQGLIAVTGLSAVMATGIAIVAQVRLYMIRVCSLIRATSGLELDREPDLRSV